MSNAEKEKPLVKLPRVRVEMPLMELNDMYEKLGRAQRVLREGNPERREQIARQLLAEIGQQMDAACGGFLAPMHV